MNELKLKELLARHTTTDMDKLELSRRISSEHTFQSVDECVEYIKKMATFVSANSCLSDGSNVNTFKEVPILVINVIDEAICSLIYEIYQQINLGDQDFLAYIKHRIEELQCTINGTAYPEEYIPIKSSLRNVLALINLLSFPVYHKEETIPSQLSYEYYKLMHTMYSLARPRDSYFRKLTEYYRNKYM